MLVVFGLVDQTEPLSIIVYIISHEVAHNFHFDSNTTQSVSQADNHQGWVELALNILILRMIADFCYVFFRIVEGNPIITFKRILFGKSSQRKSSFSTFSCYDI